MGLTTERLVLRDYHLDDYDAVHAFASDPRIATYVEWGPNTEQDSRDFLAICLASQTVTPRTGYMLAITLPETGVIGSVGLTVRADPAGNERRAEIGFTVNADFWGGGYATEAGRALLTFGLDSLGLDRVYATCRPGNIASGKALASMGMQQTGLLKDDKLIRGQWQDSLLFEAVGGQRGGLTSTAN